MPIGMNDNSARKWLRGLWCLAIAVAVVLFAANLFLGDLNQDEGWYLYAGQMVAEGKLPYVDFASTQGPVMSLVYAGAAPLVEAWGVAGGRLFTALMGFACCICAAWLAARMAPEGRKNEAGLIAFALARD